MFENLLLTIEKYDTITLYRHTNPDCDALGSQWAMASWLKERYPEKNIYVLGWNKMVKSLFPESDKVSDEIVAQSLAIILDTANSRRIDDDRYKLAKLRVHLDHHPQIEPRIEHFAELEYVVDHYAATCEILGEFFRQVEQKPLSRQIAEYLYCGLLTDTLSFKTNNTSSHTLKIAAYLTESKLDIAQINRNLFDVSLQEFEFASYLRFEAKQIIPGLMVAIVDEEALAKFNATASKAKDQVYLFGNIQEVEIWAVFAKDHDESKSFWSGSLRSKTIQINDIAMNYRGGGHRNAAGVKCLDDVSLQNLLEDLKSRLKENQ